MISRVGDSELAVIRWILPDVPLQSPHLQFSLELLGHLWTCAEQQKLSLCTHFWDEAESGDPFCLLASALAL